MSAPRVNEAPSFTFGTVKVCSICGDKEPFHVHKGDERIEGYFTVGRGQTDFQAAQAWKRRALAAERTATLDVERLAAALPEKFWLARDRAEIAQYTLARLAQDRSPEPDR